VTACGWGRERQDESGSATRVATVTTVTRRRVAPIDRIGSLWRRWFMDSSSPWTVGVVSPGALYDADAAPT